MQLTLVLGASVGTLHRAAATAGPTAAAPRAARDPAPTSPRSAAPPPPANPVSGLCCTATFQCAEVERVCCLRELLTPGKQSMLTAIPFISKASS